jgi:predicted RNase H-like nuclease
MRIAGFDMAWRPEKNNSALAIGELVGTELNVLSCRIATQSVEEWVADIVSAAIEGIAIDAPLIIRNQDGQRECEAELNTVFRAAKAGCHPSNLNLYPNAASVRAAEMLRLHGFQHLGKKHFMLECYPHPSMVEIFGWRERLLYKRGSVSDRKQGQLQLAQAILSLQAADVSLVLEDPILGCLQADYICNLRGVAVKANEDLLDALVCLYIAALYKMGQAAYVFGDVESGYVWVPKFRD